MSHSEKPEQGSRGLTRRQLLATVGSATAMLLASGAGTGWGTASAAALPGAVQQESPIWHNVKDYGAGNLGRTNVDDAPAIQSAMNAAVRTGGIVYFPPGTYYLNSSLVLYSNVKLLGASSQRSVLKSLQSHLILMVGNGVKHAEVESLGFEGTGNLYQEVFADPERAVHLKDCEHVRIRDCSFSKITNGIRITDCRHVAVSGCLFNSLLSAGNDNEGYGIVAESGEGLRITDNRFVQLPRPCIYLSAGCSYSTVSGNTAEKCKDAFVVVSSKIKPCSHNRIEGNTASGAGLAKDETSCSRGILLRSYSTDNLIQHNVISRAAFTGIMLEGEGTAELERPAGNLISGNKVDGAPEGIALLNSDGNAVTGNDVRRVKTGILLNTKGEGSGARCRSNLVSGNTLFSCSSVAIRLGSARCESNTVYGNSGAGNGEALADQGTDTAKSGF
ncbi:right-handed parallel beta-helix repeat-containing protein [Paenibacillus naphthalenovorans]|uniref:right-handed parallel beta-helix repeat-containing protein n=1 Tax=Paenibacillus naphthalenovorans TaxID=162209 RepID=UPI003D2E6D82